MGQAVAYRATEEGFAARLRKLSKDLINERDSHAETAHRLAAVERLVHRQREEIEEMRRTKAARGPAVEAREIMTVIAARWRVDIDALSGQSRSKAILHARHQAVYEVARLCPSLSSVDVGRLFHRDHSSVLAVWKNWPAKAAELGIECMPLNRERVSQ